MTCHFSILNVRFAFWAFFSENRKNSGLILGQNDDPDVKDDPNDPVLCLVITIWPIMTTNKLNAIKCLAYVSSPISKYCTFYIIMFNTEAG